MNEYFNNAILTSSLAVISALKLAGPSPQPRMRFVKSISDKLNISLNSASDLPQGTILSSCNIFFPSMHNTDISRLTPELLTPI